MHTPFRHRVAGVFLCVASGLACAEGAVELADALSAGKPNLDARLRYESVDQDNALRDAHATTLRARLGYTTATWNALDALIEYEGVFDLSQDAYNSTRNGRTGYSVVADPEGSELNQALLRFTGVPDTVIKLGRQRMVLDNARFVGNVGWRQNEQTFDSASIANDSIPLTTLTYAFLDRVNRIVRDNFDLEGHVVNARVAPLESLAVTAYAYLLDFDPGTPAPPPDSRTFGLRAGGSMPIGTAKVLYALEYAKQSDYADAPATVDADYQLAELGLKLGPVTPKLGYEVLGGDGTFGFNTALATLHAFQGWADVFLATPATGVQDLYLSLAGDAGPVNLTAVYHRFEADSGGADYGDEIDLLVAMAVNKSMNLAVKYADYSADTFAVDTRKVWVQGEYRF